MLQVEEAKEAKSDLRDSDVAWTAYRRLLRAYTALRPLMSAMRDNRLTFDGKIVSEASSKPDVATGAPALPTATSVAGPVMQPRQFSTAVRPQDAAAVGHVSGAASGFEQVGASVGHVAPVAHEQSEQTRVDAMMARQATPRQQTPEGSTEAAVAEQQRSGSAQSSTRKLGYKVDMDAASAALDADL